MGAVLIAGADGPALIEQVFPFALVVAIVVIVAALGAMGKICCDSIDELRDEQQKRIGCGVLVCVITLVLFVLGLFLGEQFAFLLIVGFAIGILIMVSAIGAGRDQTWQENRGRRVLLSWLTLLVGTLLLACSGYSTIGGVGIVALVTIAGLYASQRTVNLIEGSRWCPERIPNEQGRLIYFGMLSCFVTAGLCVAWWLGSQEEQSLIPVLLVAGFVIGILLMVSAIGAGNSEAWSENRRLRLLLSWLTLLTASVILVQWGYRTAGGVTIVALVLIPACYAVAPYIRAYLKQRRVLRGHETQKRRERSDSREQLRRERSTDEDDFQRQLQLEEQVAYPRPPRLYAPPYVTGEDRSAARIENALRLLPGQKSFFDAEVTMRSIQHSQSAPLRLFAHYRHFLSDYYLHLRRAGSDMDSLGESLDKLCKLFDEDATSLYIEAENVIAREQRAKSAEEERLQRERELRKEAELAKRKRAAERQDWELAKAEAIENRRDNLRSSDALPTSDEEEAELRYFESEWTKRYPPPN